MLEAFADFPVWLRTLIALVVLAIGVTMTIVGKKYGLQITHETDSRGRDVIVETENGGAKALFRLGIGICGIGCCLFLIAAPSSSEKNGYKF